MQIETYANPHRFMRLGLPLIPFLWAAALFTLAFALYAVSQTPPDYQQGALVKILFIHVPSAWLALGGYAFMVLAVLVGFIMRHPLAFVLARACAPIGALFTLIALMTGALWGAPSWGVFWVWDARLTSVLVLFFIYLAVLALWHAIEDDAQANRAAAILIVAGAINLPIIKFSVDWWNTLHQPASISLTNLMRGESPALDAVFLYPLLYMVLAFSLLFAALLLTRTASLIFLQKQKSRL